MSQISGGHLQVNSEELLQVNSEGPILESALQGAAFGEQIEFPIASTLTHKTNSNTHTQKKQILIPAGQKKKKKR